jgi:hypothetical protein
VSQQISKISGTKINRRAQSDAPPPMNHRVGKRAVLGAPQTSPALHGRHDRNFVSRREFEISIDEFHACPNQDALVMLPKFRLVRIEVHKQVANGGPVRYVDIQLAHSDQIAQLRVE